MAVTLRDRAQILAEWIRNVVASTTTVTWFGPNSVALALGNATASAIEGTYQLHAALLRRFNTRYATGDDLTEAAAERGVERLPAMNATVLAVFQPAASDVLGIVTATGTSKIEVADASEFAIGMSIRIRQVSLAGSLTQVTEIRTITDIDDNTGPNSGDEISVAELDETYDVSGADVRVLARVTVPAGTTIGSTSGVSFQLLAPVSTGDANTVLQGESGALALADKGWLDAVVTGTAGNVLPLTLTGPTSAIDGLHAVINPERGFGGADSESDELLRRRAVYGPAALSQESEAWLLAQAQQINVNVARLRSVGTGSTIRSTAIGVLKRNGGTFSSGDLARLTEGLNNRIRSNALVEVSNLPLNGVQVEAEITLAPNVTLRDAWIAASSELATYLDWRTWPMGQDVDEAELLRIVRESSGVASLVTASFLPAANVSVTYLPVLARVSLRDTESGEVINQELSVSFSGG